MASVGGPLLYFSKVMFIPLLTLNCLSQGCKDGLIDWAKTHTGILIGVGIGIGCLQVSLHTFELLAFCKRILSGPLFTKLMCLSLQ